MRITLFTFGTYGDARPYVALGKALKSHGYEVQIATAEKYRAMVEDSELTFYAVSGDPDEMAASFGDVTEGGSPLDNLRYLRNLLPKIGADLLIGTEGSDAIISNYNMTHLAATVAEKHAIPLIEVGLVPMLPTTDYPNPHIFADAPNWFPSALNNLTYTPVDLLLWIPFRGAINRWRREIGLKPYGFMGPFATMRRKRIPRLEAYSQHIVPRASDWGDHIHLTGFWFLDEPDWTPPDSLIAFLEAGDAPVYIGFGSMGFGNAEERTRIIREAAQNHRLVLARGWGGLSDGDTLPDTLYTLDFAPHDWLFPRMAGVIHHGGAGTIAAGLRAGVPQSVISFYGDQPYWGRLIHRLGLGTEHLPRKALTGEHLQARIRALVENTAMRQRAQAMRENIIQEDGIGNAVKAIERILDAHSPDKLS